MTAMSTIYQQFKPFSSERFSQLVVYALALTFGLFVIIKLVAIESLLQSNHRLLLANQSLSKQQTLMLNQLNRLESQVTVCEHAIKAQQILVEDIHVCRTQLDTIKTEFHQLQAHTTPEALAFVIQQENQKLLSSNQHRFENTKQKHRVNMQHSHHTSDPKLPFQILNIDMWNGEPLLMINHQGHTDLLSKQDTLAGWTVIDIHFDSGKVTFRNRQGRLVKTWLRGNETAAEIQENEADS